MTREARQVLAELELISHGKCASYNSSGAGENPNVLPFGESRPPHEYWRHRFQAASERELPGLVREARDELEAIRVRASVKTDDSTEDDWILKDGTGYSAEDVARRFNTTVARVRGLRIKNQRDMEFGQKLHQTRSVPRMEELIGGGMGARQIAMLTGEKRSTVQDAISRFRKAS